MVKTTNSDIGYAIEMEAGEITKIATPEGEIAFSDGKVIATSNISTNNNIIAGNNITAGNDIFAGHNVDAENDVIARRNVNAYNNVKAQKDVNADRDVNAVRNVEADGDIIGNQDVSARGELIGQRLDVKEEYAKFTLAQEIPLVTDWSRLKTLREEFSSIKYTKEDGIVTLGREGYYLVIGRARCRGLSLGDEIITGIKYNQSWVTTDWGIASNSGGGTSTTLTALKLPAGAKLRMGVKGGASGTVLFGRKFTTFEILRLG